MDESTMSEVGSQARLEERRIIAEKKGRELDQKEEAKNHSFTQLDDLGAVQLEKLLRKSPKAAGLFLKLLPMMDGRGAVVISRQILAELAGVDYKNLSRIMKTLTEFGMIRDLKIKGTPIIAINPEVAWRSYNNQRPYAVFNANVILSADEFEDDEDFQIRKANAVIAMAKKRKGAAKNISQQELEPPVGEATIEPELLD